jgi:hypothetical protein
MKKIVKPEQKEEALYYTDFKGFVCPEWGPPIELKIKFNYGSKFDSDDLDLHLTDDEIKPILDHIKENLSEDFKSSLNKKLKEKEIEFQDLVETRDWTSCEYHANSISFLKYLLNIKE